jgi:uncharacterized membrane-anchored protein
VAPQNTDELVEAVREVCPEANDVRNQHGLVVVEGSPFMSTGQLRDMKNLGLSLSFIPENKAVFVHDEFGRADYTYAYGADGSEQP